MYFEACLRLQVGLHRLLQRGFAALYSYNLPEQADTRMNCSDLLRLVSYAVPDASSCHDVPADQTSEYLDSVMQAETNKDLHYKLQGAR